MPRLADDRMELYAAARVRGRSMTQAAIDAGYVKGAHNVGSRLNKRGDVQRRMYELQTIHIVPIAPAPTSDGTETGNSVVTPAPDGIQTTTEITRDVVTETKPGRIAEVVSLYRVTRASKEYNVSAQCLRLLAQMNGDLEPSTLPNKAALATLAGVSEIHAMVQRLMQDVPMSERPALLAAAPELIDIVAECTPIEGV